MDYWFLYLHSSIFTHIDKSNNSILAFPGFLGYGLTTNYDFCFSTYVL